MRLRLLALSLDYPLGTDAAGRCLFSRLLAAYANPQLDALLEQGRALEPGAERDAVYAQALEIVHGDAPIIPMVHKVFVAAASERLQGFRVHPSAFFYDFKSVTLAE